VKLTRNNFWFADLADDDGDFAGLWQVFLQESCSCLPLPLGFLSKEDAEDYIRTTIMTAEGDYE
jgi:hypothetical protein